MSTPPHTTGGCHCGAVRCEVSGEPLLSVNCHCRDCSHIGGSVGHSAFAIRRDAVTVAGDVTWYESPGDSGNMVRRGFCPRCGTRLFGEPELAPDLMSISATSLDDTTAFRPQANIYMKSKAPWAAADETLQAFDGLPPVPEA